MTTIQETNTEGTETSYKLRQPYRDHGEMFAIVVKLHGADQILAACEDGKERHCRIPGKLKKKVWMREGDLIIVRLWDFQPIKADVVWRYLPLQTEKLKRMGLLTKLPI
ncbi:MAG: translation initiation factor eIF-1A [Candidatus Diapherotrites archaeon]|uniref:Translation initiation factor 1A n=1 Tax=Candidatus Iainarchaeum sp. TaxID=3101447 RepID=A0A8T4CAX4_9ARCH|nr:translation initiation factor eIF-1A [Candidatus Diapherotrites archaeon]